MGNTMFDILVSRKFKTQGRQWYGVKPIKSIFVEKSNDGERVGAPLYYLKKFSFLQQSWFQAASLYVYKIEELLLLVLT